ncbi:hypothetical protein ANN_12575 [Periplaneta americana]|uniref:Uncharacterized protein n=1 Tax=Periplaneta americana TaxID=6978 RepID=A0ABQ8THI0_PERAM|nr:hypothetical protein ANN_12575 [Periplaneta americana]
MGKALVPVHSAPALNYVSVARTQSQKTDTEYKSPPLPSQCRGDGRKGGSGLPTSDGSDRRQQGTNRCAHHALEALQLTQADVWKHEILNTRIRSVQIDRNMNVILLLNNARTHARLHSREAIARLEWAVLRNLWPPRSPDLTTPDFFLWGYLKDRVYATRPQTLEDLKHNITQEIQANNRVLQRVASDMERRVELCLMQDGGHFEHLL